MNRRKLYLLPKRNLRFNSLQQIWPQNTSGRQQDSASSEEGVSLITDRLDALKLYAKQDSKQFRFLELPAEIRNNIYEWLYVMSRCLDEMYQIPDFEVRGDGSPVNSIGTIDTLRIRWLNIPSFPLLLVNKQIRNEVFPIISAEAWFQIRTDSRIPPSGFYDFPSLESFPLLSGTRKVTIDLTPRWEHYLEGIQELAVSLMTFDKLKEITLRILVYEMMPKDFSELEYFFAFAKDRTGLTLILELIDIKSWDSFDMKDVHKALERMIYRKARRFGNIDVRPSMGLKGLSSMPLLTSH
ncbi:hypothetical protein B0O99DRAFT_688645 [Bisporella sp. PMI_857]|nr:hypothetical protein B0O99DRAFT_688645 [Bisporella sp. PMI_857]